MNNLLINKIILLIAVVAVSISGVASAQPHKKHKHKVVRNTAPVHHYHAVGHRVTKLPVGFVALTIGGSPFYYHSGVYYRPHKGNYVVTRAPVGAVVVSLPHGFRTIHLRGRPYYVFNSTYYIYDRGHKHYVVVEPPAVDQAENTEPFSATNTELFVYPKNNQSPEQVSRDRYECYLWAVNETGFDPTRAEQKDEAASADDYRRASTACLDARGYAVN